MTKPERVQNVSTVIILELIAKLMELEACGRFLVLMLALMLASARNYAGVKPALQQHSSIGLIWCELLENSESRVYHPRSTLFRLFRYNMSCATFLKRPTHGMNFPENAALFVHVNAKNSSRAKMWLEKKTANVHMT